MTYNSAVGKNEQSRAPGPDFPNGISSAATVPYGVSFAVLSMETRLGEQDAIYVYDVESSAWTMLQGEALSEPKRSSAAFLVDHKIFPACK